MGLQLRTVIVFLSPQQWCALQADGGSKTALFSALHRLLPYIIIANILLLPPAIVVVCRSIFTIRQLFVVLLIAAFCMSYYFTYNRKYQVRP